MSFSEWADLPGLLERGREAGGFRGNQNSAGITIMPKTGGQITIPGHHHLEV